jgi:hypothetical protein
MITSIQNIVKQEIRKIAGAGVLKLVQKGKF